MNTPRLLDLFKLFLYIGATGFGGVAMLPTIRTKLVTERKYLSGEQYDYGIALAQMLPGPTIVQVAAFTGYSLYGYVGALLAGDFRPGGSTNVSIDCAVFHVSKRGNSQPSGSWNERGNSRHRTPSDI